MPLNELIQKLIHTLETGRGTRYLWFIALGLAIVGLAFLYDGRAYRNLATQEAMDSAQLARNIADGKGYTTLFIRQPPTWISHKSNSTPIRTWRIRRYIHWYWPD